MANAPTVLPRAAVFSNESARGQTASAQRRAQAPARTRSLQKASPRHGGGAGFRDLRRRAGQRPWRRAQPARAPPPPGWALAAGPAADAPVPARNDPGAPPRDERSAARAAGDRGGGS